MKTEAEYKRVADQYAARGEDDLASAYLALMDCARRERERKIAGYTRELEAHMPPEEKP